MLPRSRSARVLTVAGASVLVAAGLAAAPAIASSPRVSTASRSVTIVLKAPHQAALNRLSAATNLSHAQRMRELKRVLPSAAAHRQVTNTLRAEGFTIGSQSAWTINATAPETTMAATFGDLTPAPQGADEAARLHAASTLPKLPADLAQVTAAALPTTGGPALFHQNSCSKCLTGTSFRNAYATPDVKPATGEDANGALTIATLQFAGWNESDLTKYAAAAGLDDPVSSSQFIQIPVDQSAVKKASTSEGEADVEVDLDQQTLLSTAPNADYRAYFAPANTMGGYVDDIAQVVDDVAQDANSYQGGDSKIVALSSSWVSARTTSKQPSMARRSAQWRTS